MQPRIALFGDSHMHAVQRAIKRRNAAGAPVPLSAHRRRKEKNGTLVGDTSLEEFLKIVRRFSPDDVVLSLIGGNQHAVFSTIQHPQPFDFLEPGTASGDLASGVALIPYQAVSSYLAGGIEGRDGKSLGALRAATVARVVHVIPPPPKRDNAFITSYHETHFAAENITAFGVSPHTLRVKAWRLQVRLLVVLCERLGIEVLMPPSAALDGDGFLSKDFYANDATHANESYGELLLKAVEARYLAESDEAEVCREGTSL